MWGIEVLSLVIAVLVLHPLIPLVSSSSLDTTSPGWKTLQGCPPVVIARGGFSRVYPDSSLGAYSLALNTSLPNVILWCDVQFTKDGAPICSPDIKLNNATDINLLYPNKPNHYLINGVLQFGWFSIDFTLTELARVTLQQGLYYRSASFDGNQYRILTVEDVAKLVKASSPGLWLNVQYDLFLKQQNLSTEHFLQSLCDKGVHVNYISSPEVGFLRSIRSVFNPKTTTLVFRFLEENEIEPTTNQTYGSLLKNLTHVRTFASGILVPKDYIWPLDPYLYLKPHTSLVSDAHKEGLQVFVSGLVNDAQFSYNFSYDPLAECLSFIDDGDFSVDGVLSDFPTTPSAAIDCFSGLGVNATKQVETLVISKYGASGDYPACTDLAYKKAILDGADVIDCPVQMSKDGIPFCLSFIDLIFTTTVSQSRFRNRSTTIPEIKPGPGIYTFNLTWNEIQTLSPSMLSPFGAKYHLYRNPKFQNQGKLLTLSDFLSLTKGQTRGILISIENAAFLAEKLRISIADAVLDSLRQAGFDKPGPQKVMIQSTHSSVLKIFKEKSSKYERVYKVNKIVGDILESAVEDIKGFADSVVVHKQSVVSDAPGGFLQNYTNVVTRLKSFNLSVYVETFNNEYVSQEYDYYSDPFVQINSFVAGAKVDGIITDFPKTADRYRKNKCIKLGNKTPYMSPIEPGRLLKQILSKEFSPPPAPPLPVLPDTDVTEPPLPSPGLRPPVTAPTTA